MSDLIERQKAIDALNNILADYVPYLHGVTEAIPLDCAVTIQTLPSAQPVITCDGCRFVGTYDTDFPCCSCIRREKDYYEPER